MTALADQMQAQEFDHVWTVADGTIVDAEGFAPSVYWVSEEASVDGKSHVEIEAEGWEMVTHGLSGQDRYDGPVMHPSEYIGTGVASRVAELAEDFTAFAVVEVMDPDDMDALVGWTIVGRKAV